MLTTTRRVLFSVALDAFPWKPCQGTRGAASTARLHRVARGPAAMAASPQRASSSPTYAIARRIGSSALAPDRFAAYAALPGALLPPARPDHVSLAHLAAATIALTSRRLGPGLGDLPWDPHGRLLVRALYVVCTQDDDRGAAQPSLQPPGHGLPEAASERDDARCLGLLMAAFPDALGLRALAVNPLVLTRWQRSGRPIVAALAQHTRHLILTGEPHTVGDDLPAPVVEAVGGCGAWRALSSIDVVSRSCRLDAACYRAFHARAAAADSNTRGAAPPVRYLRAAAAARLEAQHLAGIARLAHLRVLDYACVDGVVMADLRRVCGARFWAVVGPPREPAAPSLRAVLAARAAPAPAWALALAADADAAWHTPAPAAGDPGLCRVLMDRVVARGEPLRQDMARSAEGVSAGAPRAEQCSVLLLQRPGFQYDEAQVPPAVPVATPLLGPRAADRPLKLRKRPRLTDAAAEMTTS
ncbi:hypothetical protein CXG81DRAFT_25202 [Caulochytrium protostelioides]|uniref:Uncharacterized protein n=1 Tax=Caulochytrium protostelioides TaxID=1555241 RepID=A0A4P9X9T4_9FUNG|nr:hypothetical protein CXG81DRAFT_25202 [Caulochytrium protostelioides]|eukprot:RKP02114.1 hypothetical protein CXG81DRAFT_25202 [Caulochytrium protostelioides]